MNIKEISKNDLRVTLKYEEKFQSEEFLLLALNKNARDEKVYKIIIAMGAAWNGYYSAPSEEEKKIAMGKINLLEIERSRVMGMTVN